jgi:hypothetical protein
MPLFRETEEFSIFDNVRWFPLKIKKSFDQVERDIKKTNWRVALWSKGSFSDANVSDMSFKEILKLQGLVLTSLAECVTL